MWRPAADADHALAVRGGRSDARLPAVDAVPCPGGHRSGHHRVHSGGLGRQARCPEAATRPWPRLRAPHGHRTGGCGRCRRVGLGRASGSDRRSGAGRGGPTRPGRWCHAASSLVRRRYPRRTPAAGDPPPGRRRCVLARHPAGHRRSLACGPRWRRTAARHLAAPVGRAAARGRRPEVPRGGTRVLERAAGRSGPPADPAPAGGRHRYRRPLPEACRGPPSRPHRAAAHHRHPAAPGADQRSAADRDGRRPRSLARPPAGHCRGHRAGGCRGPRPGTGGQRDRPVPYGGLVHQRVPAAHGRRAAGLAGSVGGRHRLAGAAGPVQAAAAGDARPRSRLRRAALPASAGRRGTGRPGTAADLRQLPRPAEHRTGRGLESGTCRRVDARRGRRRHAAQPRGHDRRLDSRRTRRRAAGGHLHLGRRSAGRDGRAVPGADLAARVDGADPVRHLAGGERADPGGCAAGVAQPSQLSQLESAWRSR